MAPAAILMALAFLLHTEDGWDPPPAIWLQPPLPR